MRRQIERHPKYCINEEGAVFRIKPDGTDSLLLLDLSNGYPRVDLDGRKEYVSRLVLETFDPTDDETLKVFYIDGDHTNTRLSNLCWLSPSDIQLYSQYTVEYRKQMLGVFERGAR